MGVNSDILAVWIARMERSANGLDFTQPEDRAAFRQRISTAMQNAKRDLIVNLASHWGRDIPGNASHQTAVRAAADAWIARH